MDKQRYSMYKEELNEDDIKKLGFEIIAASGKIFEFAKDDFYLVWDCMTGMVDITKNGELVYYGKPNSKESLERILKTL